jgi:flagellar basal body P-ring protein FlgI
MRNNILKQVENVIENLLECVVKKAIVKVKSCTFSLGKIPNAAGDALTSSQTNFFSNSNKTLQIADESHISRQQGREFYLCTFHLRI